MMVVMAAANHGCTSLSRVEALSSEPSSHSAPNLETYMSHVGLTYPVLLFTTGWASNTFQPSPTLLSTFKQGFREVSQPDLSKLALQELRYTVRYQKLSSRKGHPPETPFQSDL